MRTLTPSAALIAAALIAAPLSAQSGWTVSKGDGTAALVFGKPETTNAFRLDCSAKGTSISTWTRRPPRNVTEGEFPTRLSLFQGNREIVIGSTGRVLPAGGTRVDGLLDNPAAILDGMTRQSRFVLVSFAGRGTAPSPSAETLQQFREACPKG
ncbi:hypothetical protein [Sandaracinobacter sp.]|uniref:hypothetical protein n=1 Tax=Sandaracinobacter sp. TaxID=2487581 RepID=UPI0035AFCF6C